MTILFDSGQPFITACISRPDVVPSAIAFLNSATLEELAEISVVSVWTVMMFFWCSSCSVIAMGETLESAPAMTFSFPFKYSIFTSYCDDKRSSLCRCDELGAIVFFHMLTRLVFILDCHCVAIDIVMTSLKCKYNTQKFFLNVGMVLFSLCQASGCIDGWLSSSEKIWP